MMGLYSYCGCIQIKRIDALSNCIYELDISMDLDDKKERSQTQNSIYRLKDTILNWSTIT